MTRRHALVLMFLMVFMMLLLASLAPGRANGRDGRAVDVTQEYENAMSQYRTLLESPARQQKSENWKSVEGRFRSILEFDRGGPYGDGATFMLGEIHYEKYRLFRQRDDLKKAVRIYETVLQSYPLSSLADDALIRLADIHYYNLSNPRRAYDIYLRVIREYPEGDMATRAKVRRVAIKHRHPEYKSAPPPPAGTGGSRTRLSKPTPSPGAVLGGGQRPMSRAGPGSPVVARKPPEPQPGKREETSQTPAFEGPKREVERASGENRTGGDRKTPVPREAPEEAPAARAADAPPPHPLLQEGPVPLKRPSDDLPPLRSLRTQF